MPRRDRSYGQYHQPGRKAGNVSRRNRTSKGGRYALKNGKVPKGKRK